MSNSTTDQSHPTTEDTQEQSDSYGTNFKTVRRIRYCSKARGLDQLCLRVLADHADDLGRCWPGVRLIRKEMGVTQDTVTACINRLTQSGELIADRKQNRGSRYIVACGCSYKELILAMTTPIEVKNKNGETVRRPPWWNTAEEAKAFLAEPITVKINGEEKTLPSPWKTALETQANPSESDNDPEIQINNDPKTRINNDPEIQINIDPESRQRTKPVEQSQCNKARERTQRSLSRSEQISPSSTSQFDERMGSRNLNPGPQDERTKLGDLYRRIDDRRFHRKNDLRKELRKALRSRIPWESLVAKLDDVGSGEDALEGVRTIIALAKVQTTMDDLQMTLDAVVDDVETHVDGLYDAGTLNQPDMIRTEGLAILKHAIEGHGMVYTDLYGLYVDSVTAMELDGDRRNVRMRSPIGWWLKRVREECKKHETPVETQLGAD